MVIASALPTFGVFRALNVAPMRPCFGGRPHERHRRHVASLHLTSRSGSLHTLAPVGIRPAAQYEPRIVGSFDKSHLIN